MRERMFESIHAEYKQSAVNEWALVAVAAVPYLVGYIAGVIVRLCVWLVAAIIAGYKAGRGNE